MKKILSLTIALVMLAAAVVFAVPAGAEPPFDDVKETRWSYSSIVYSVENGYMKGIGERKFSPSGTLTRAMVATVLWRRQGEPAPTAPSGFSDVPEGKWYSDAVAWAKEQGVVRGVSASKFKPDDNVTREQLATMLFRFSETAPVCVPERADLGVFPDGSSAHDWAREAMGWAVEAALVKGSSDGSLDPSGYATREQFAAIIERFDNTFKLEYNEPVLFSHYTEPDYPLVGDADLYVAVDGDDSAAGDFDHPLATWNEAALRVRELKKTGKDGDIVVAFKAGDYGPLSLTLTAEDSGAEDRRVVYCKYGDGDVIFNNGFDVREEEFRPLDENEKGIFPSKSADRIKKADISDRLRDYDPKTCMVLSDSGPLALARFPNLYADGGDNLMQSGITESPNHIRIYNTLFNKRVAKYHTVDGLILYGYIVHGWYKDLISTDGYTVDGETGDFIYYVPHPEEAYGGSLRYDPVFVGGFAHDYYQIAILNASEELDVPGEFWIDGNTGTFYVCDPEGDCHFTGPGVMLTLGKTEYVTLRGLDFINSEDCFIYAPDHPRGLTLDRCRFEGCSAESMLHLEATDQGVPFDLLITRCEFSTCAGAAVYMYTINHEDLFGTGTGAVVDNNYFTRTNLRIGNSSAIRAYAASPRITHNYFKRCCWQCIGTGSSVNLLAEYNVFDEACCNGDDTGAIGKGVNLWACGTVIRHNLFLNVKGGQNGRFCVYLDNAIGADVCSNLFYNVDVSVMNNDISKFNSFCDNVTVKGPAVCEYSIDHTLAVIEAMTTGNENDLLNSYTYRRWVDLYAYFDAHPAIREEAMRQWPGLFEFTTDPARWQEREFCENSSLVITGNRSFNETEDHPEFAEIFARYSTIEDNVPDTFGHNPLFVNPTAGDYRIREGADFPDIQFEKIGRY